MYGIQARAEKPVEKPVFENDVKMYGIQALLKSYRSKTAFENDVKMYGIQAIGNTKQKNAVV